MSLSLIGGCTSSSESTLVKMPHCWKSHVAAQFYPLPGAPYPQSPYQTHQDSFMYRVEHGVVSYMLDDDNCDCYSTLNAGHAMCHGGFNSIYGMENVYGVGLLNEEGCYRNSGPSGTNSLYLYYKGIFTFPTRVFK